MHPQDVYRLFDRDTRPHKQKRAICVCPQAQLFLRINSQPLWPPHHLIFAANCDFIEKDSYVELSKLVRYFGLDMQQAQYLGRLTRPVALSIMEAVEAACTLSQRHKDMVRERWGL